MRNKFSFRQTKSSRTVLVWSFFILLLLISLVFYRQYREYRINEERLVIMYNAANSATDDLEELFSLFTKSENTFRLYTIDYDANTFKRYSAALDSVKHYTDSLALLPLVSNPLANTPAEIAYRNILATEYATLKQSVEQLVQHTQDSLQMVTFILPTRLTAAAENMTNDTRSEELIVVEQDTIIRKRKSLFRRIFDASDDTIVVDVRTTKLTKPEDVGSFTGSRSPHPTTLVSGQYADWDGLRGSFAQLQEKERELVNANISLLSNVRNGIEKIREAQLGAKQAAVNNDLQRYRISMHTHNQQFAMLLFLMLGKIIILWYYIRRVSVNERKLENERAHVSKLAEEKSDILVGISHEIRTPLTTLLGTVDMMRKDLSLFNDTQGAPYQNIIESSYNSLTSINHTINDILNLSRLEGDNVDVVLTYFSPLALFNSVLSLQEHQLALKGLALHRSIDIDPNLSILSNEFRIKQIASNLLGNAIKYTPSGEITFKANVQNSNGDMRLRLEVNDTGIGIPAEHKAHIFRKYYTVNEQKNSSSFGLGLYITKLLTDQLSGDISFTSELGKGTTFVAEIPFSESKVDQTAVTHGKRPQTLSDLPRDLRFLYLDDNPINILYMQQFLSSNNQQIDTASHPHRALELLSENPYDILITDINMPEMDGWAVLETVKSSSKHANLKVLALSAEPINLDGFNPHNSSTIGFDGIIPKPFTEDDFATIISQTIYPSKDNPKY